MQIKQLSRARYNSYVGYTKHPMIGLIADEVEFYANAEETVIGLILFDRTDQDFNVLLLGKDKDGKFRCFEVESSIPKKADAILFLKKRIEENSQPKNATFPQGDETGSLDFFSPVYGESKLHPYFRLLSSEKSFSPAKEIIKIMMCHYLDIDGNFVEQFQTEGFDARIWELYLFNYLTEAGFLLEREYHAPDFVVTNGSEKFAIEAVTVGRKKENKPTGDPKFFTEEEMMQKRQELENEMPIRFGSPLFSKLKKQYWNLPHVLGKPLIFAIADFHDDLSMIWSSTALITYLYGVKHEHTRDDRGKLIIKPIPVSQHVSGTKVIPSGFFFQPDSENISAILFSANGSISKFNRMGRYAGLGEEKLIMFREGACHKHDHNSATPDVFRFEIKPSEGDDISEIWAEGLSMYHNPVARHPIHPESFPLVAHHHFLDGQIVSILPDFYPYFSTTTTLVIEE